MSVKRLNNIGSFFGKVFRYLHENLHWALYISYIPVLIIMFLSVFIEHSIVSSQYCLSLQTTAMYQASSVCLYSAQLCIKPVLSVFVGHSYVSSHFVCLYRPQLCIKPVLSVFTDHSYVYQASFFYVLSQFNLSLYQASYVCLCSHSYLYQANSFVCLEATIVWS